MASWKDDLKRQRVRKRGGVRDVRDPETIRTKRMAKLAKLAFVGVLGLFLVGLVAFPLFASNLPSPDKIIRKEGYSTKILDRNGQVLYDIYVNQKRTPAAFDVMPEYLKQATIAIEDKNFYKHKGFDPTGYVRAGFNIVVRGKLQGGSTLTQQLVKNVLLTPERTVVRKLKELVITLQIESRYSKDEILQMYLNEAPYGGTAWGVEAAAETYFNKNVSDLNLTESAFLAGLPQAPSRYSPYSGTTDAYKGRTENVLRRMREDGYITQEQEDAAKQELENLSFVGRGANFKAPHFVQYVQNVLVERYGERVVEQGGLRVTTTLDLSLQETTQEIVAEEIAAVLDLNITNGAAVVLDSETGEVLAMVGSKDFNAEDYDGQFNVAVQGMRQPGSAIKPVTYLTALKKGYTASTLIMDVPTSFPGGAGQPDYQPVNYDGQYRGPVQMRYALANSLNVPAVKMLAMVGLRDVLQTAHELGVESYEPTDELLSKVGLSLALGGGELRLIELTGAYAALMNGGSKVEPISILKVEDSDGKVLEEHDANAGQQIISPEHAYIIADILSDNQARSSVFGVNSLLNVPGWDIAVKTGTTNDKRDNWTLGGNPHVTVGVWVGNNDFSAMKQVASGISGASPIWRRILLAALDGKPKVEFTQPDGIVTAQVDAVSGYSAHDEFPERSEIFVKGTEPGEDTVHLKLKLCKGGDRLATPSDIAANNYDEREFFAFKEEDPTAGPGGHNRWQEAILNWISTQGKPEYSPPTEYCDGINSAPLNVEFVEPRDRDSNLDNNLKIRFSFQSVNRVELAELEIDGTQVRSFSGPPYEFETDLEDGVYELRAIAHDSEGNQSDRRITIGIGVPWDFKPTPKPTATPKPTDPPLLDID